MGIAQEIRRELWGGSDPFDSARPSDVDTGYPHTHLVPAIVAFLLGELRPKFWLEVGSMLGGSLIRTAQTIDRLQMDTEIVAVDPFTGDVNMWAWEKSIREEQKWSFLRPERGRPTIYDRFLANVCAEGVQARIAPIVCTSLVGMRLLARLHREGRISGMPEVIYLDSAHEAGETLLELQLAWSILAPGGVLFGDDWKWHTVRNDVLRFHAGGTLPENEPRKQRCREHFGNPELDEGVLIVRKHWLLFKPAA